MTSANGTSATKPAIDAVININPAGSATNTSIYIFGLFDRVSFTDWKPNK
jgi:hypothetical protein